MTEQVIAGHYGQGGLLDAIQSGIESLGKTPRTITLADLAPVDEFHVGGRSATNELLGQLDLVATDRVLDLGSGIGGLARTIAAEHGVSVVGVDLTPEYVDVARTITEWVGLADRVSFEVGSATNLDDAELGFDAESFDVATLLHVGMNIEDKAALFAEVHRVLRPGGRFAIYDNMWSGDRELDYPVPWASTEATSFVEDAAAYRAAAEAAGFEIAAVRDQSQRAIDFFASLRNRSAQHDGPPPLGLHLLMGPDTAAKTGNLFGAIASGSIAPTEMICIKP